MDKKYILDTNVLRTFINFYTPEVFPEIWEKIERMIDEGLIYSVREVYKELELQFGADNEDFLWVKNHKDIFLTPDNEECKLVSNLFQKKHLQNNIRKRNIRDGMPCADPFLAAVAKRRGCTVVSAEVYQPNAAKLPNLCKELSVEYLERDGFLKILRGIK